jgi:uroporphyrinogen decarboxylase
VEYLVDDTVVKPIVTKLLGRRWVEDLGNRKSQSAYLDNFIAFWSHLGYDCVRYERGLTFPERQIIAADTAPGVRKQRAWADEHRGSIRSWEEFDRYPWPRIEDFDFFPFEYLNDHLPEGMGLLSCHAGGIFEHLSWIMSLEGLCLSLHDNPALVQAVADRIGSLLSGFYDHLLGLDRLAAIFTGDDMGFRSSTLISPDDLRRYVLPWHKKFAAMAHAKRIPYFLHSCGNIDAIMEDLISDIEIDGKHSFEDAIITAEDFQQRYGRRIAVLGGLDVHTLTVGSPDEVRQRTRALIDECGAKGRFAVGSGNSIPSYVPVANYLAMVDEALD